MATISNGLGIVISSPMQRGRTDVNMADTVQTMYNILHNQNAEARAQDMHPINLENNRAIANSNIVSALDNEAKYNTKETLGQLLASGELPLDYNSVQNAGLDARQMEMAQALLGTKLTNQKTDKAIQDALAADRYVKDRTGVGSLAEYDVKRVIDTVNEGPRIRRASISSGVGNSGRVNVGGYGRASLPTNIPQTPQLAMGQENVATPTNTAPAMDPSLALYNTYAEHVSAGGLNTNPTDTFYTTPTDANAMILVQDKEGNQIYFPKSELDRAQATADNYGTEVQYVSKGGYEFATKNNPLDKNVYQYDKTKREIVVSKLGKRQSLIPDNSRGLTTEQIDNITTRHASLVSDPHVTTNSHAFQNMAKEVVTPLYASLESAYEGEELNKMRQNNGMMYRLLAAQHTGILDNINGIASKESKKEIFDILADPKAKPSELTKVLKTHLGEGNAKAITDVIDSIFTLTSGKNMKNDDPFSYASFLREMSSDPTLAPEQRSLYKDLLDKEKVSKTSLGAFSQNMSASGDQGLNTYIGVYDSKDEGRKYYKGYRSNTQALANGEKVVGGFIYNPVYIQYLLHAIAKRNLNKTSHYNPINLALQQNNRGDLLQQITETGIGMTD